MLISSTAICLAASALVTASSLPKLVERIRRMASGEGRYNPPDLCRDPLQGPGNGLWVYVG